MRWVISSLVRQTKCMHSDVIFLALAALFTSGCNSDLKEIRETSAPVTAEVESAEPLEWGGLKVQFAGRPWATAPKVVILLHGYGASGSDLVPLGRILDEKNSTAFIFPQAPIAIGRNEFAWAHQGDSEYERSRAQVIALIDQVLEANPQARISVGGFSQGATIASNLLSADSPKIASVLLFSPKPLLFREPTTEGSRAKVYLAHGRKDEMIPFSDVEQLKNTLESKGYQVNWNAFDGGHEITGESLEAARQFLSES